tara:strand:+ start:911 stop:1060 length:150 start_codon:yes stop_codon:yes gene_type:complete
MDKMIEESNILSKLIEITDMKLFLAEREVKLRKRLEKIKHEREDNNAQT